MLFVKLHIKNVVWTNILSEQHCYIEKYWTVPVLLILIYVLYIFYSFYKSLESIQ